MSIIELNERVELAWGGGEGVGMVGEGGVDGRGVFAYSYHAKLL